MDRARMLAARKGALRMTLKADDDIILTERQRNRQKVSQSIREAPQTRAKSVQDGDDFASTNHQGAKNSLGPAEFVTQLFRVWRGRVASIRHPH
ncbi:hypothetical protein EON65_49925 [archaeon]|nr:MAG: hypothetical protein EON65_49925 [archaeon]